MPTKDSELELRRTAGLILLRHYNLVIKVFLLIIIIIRRLIIAVMHQVETMLLCR